MKGSGGMVDLWKTVTCIRSASSTCSPNSSFQTGHIVFSLCVVTPKKISSKSITQYGSISFRVKPPGRVGAWSPLASKTVRWISPVNVLLPPAAIPTGSAWTRREKEELVLERTLYNNLLGPALFKALRLVHPRRTTVVSKVSGLLHPVSLGAPPSSSPHFNSLTTRACACLGWKTQMEGFEKPQIIVHVEKSLNYTVYDVKWIPCSAKFVVLGSHPRDTGALQIFELSKGELKLLSEVRCVSHVRDTARLSLPRSRSPSVREEGVFQVRHIRSCEPPSAKAGHGKFCWTPSDLVSCRSSHRRTMSRFILQLENLNN